VRMNRDLKLTTSNLKIGVCRHVGVGFVAFWLLFPGLGSQALDISGFRQVVMGLFI
jgi:hypothetical protein